MKCRRRGLLYGNATMGTLNPDEVGGWFETESGPLVLYARQWLDCARAEDVVQEAFLRLMQQRIPPDHTKAWLYRAVRNLALNRVRSVGRRSQREETAAAAAPGWFVPDPGAELDARQAETALQALPADEREIVTLRIWGGLTLEEIGSALELSAPTVLRRYREALRRIRNQLEMPCLTKIH
jgi:RNA polymerase sigma-70 factor, ECF subfamily